MAGSLLAKFRHIACDLGGAEAYLINVLVSSLTETLLRGVVLVTSLKGAPSGCGYVFSAMPSTPIQTRIGLMH